MGPSTTRDPERTDTRGACAVNASTAPLFPTAQHLHREQRLFAGRHAPLEPREERLTNHDPPE
jgi:hypothetical protein